MLSEVAGNASIFTSMTIFFVLGFGLSLQNIIKDRKFNVNKDNSFFGVRNKANAWSLSVNLVCSALGSSVFYAYPEVGIIAGVMGAVIYALSGALPLMALGVVGIRIKRYVPESFVLGTFVNYRFGLFAQILFTLLSLLIMFVYMISELSSLRIVVETLSNKTNAVVVLVLECVFTGIYTFFGGFSTSLFTDNLQGTLVCILILVSAISIGAKVKVDPNVDLSELAVPKLLSYQLILILPIAIFFNDLMLSSFWQRIFAAKNNSTLFWGSFWASGIAFIITFFTGFCGVLSQWSGAWPGTDKNSAPAASFFLLLSKLPEGISVVVLVCAVCLSMAVYDSLQCAFVATLSNDFFRNRIPLIYCRVFVLALNAVVVIVALNNSKILSLYLLCDLLSAAIMPAVLIGMFQERLWTWKVKGFDVIAGSIISVLACFTFFSLYYKSAVVGSHMLIDLNIYGNDWSAVGAFFVTPGFSLLGTIFTSLLRNSLPASFKIRHARLREWLGLDINAQNIKRNETIKEEEEEALVN